MPFAPALVNLGSTDETMFVAFQLFLTIVVNYNVSLLSDYMTMCYVKCVKTF